MSSPSPSSSSPSILYGFVAFSSSILVDNGDKDKFHSVVDRILKELPKASTKAYTHDEYTFCFISDTSGYVFGCVCDQQLKNTTIFAFLKEVQQKYESFLSENEDSSQNKKDDQSKFKKTLKSAMVKYSNEKEVNKIVAIKEELNEVQNVMRVNIDKVLERGDKLSELEEKSSSLEMEALGFKRRSQQLRRSMWCANLRMKLLLACIVFTIVAVFVLIVSLSVCGSTFERCKPPPAPPVVSPPTPSAVPDVAPPSVVRR